MAPKFHLPRCVVRTLIVIGFIIAFLGLVQIIVLFLYHSSRNVHYVSFVTGVDKSDLVISATLPDETMSADDTDITGCKFRNADTDENQLQIATDAFDAVGNLLPTAFDICCSAIISVYAIYQTYITQKQSDMLRNYEQFYNVFSKLLCEQGTVELKPFATSLARPVPLKEECLLSDDCCIGNSDTIYSEWSISSSIPNTYVYSLEKLTICTDEQSSSFSGNISVHKSNQRICFYTGAKKGSHDEAFLNILYDDTNPYKSYRIIIYAHATYNAKMRGGNSIGHCVIRASINPGSVAGKFTLSEIHINEV